MGGHRQLDWLAKDHHAVSDALMDRGFVPIYPPLVSIAGGIKAAIMLGQAIGLSRSWLKHHKSRNGWFWMSAAEWQAATGLTAREQETARKSLVDAGVWEERRTRNPSRLYFRIQLAALAVALGLTPPTGSATPTGQTDGDLDSGARWQWSDAAANTLFGQADMFFKPLADLAGGVMPGLLLSRLLAMQRAAIQDRSINPQGQFTVRFDALADSLQIGTKVIRNAREQLRNEQLVIEEREGAGSNSRVLVSVNVVAILAKLKTQPTTEMHKRVAAAREDKQRQRAITRKESSGTGPETFAAKRQRRAFVDPAQLPLTDAWDQQVGHGALLSIANRQNGTPVDNHGALLSVASDSWCPFVGCHGALLSVAYTENKYRNPPPKSERETPPVDNSEDWRRRIFEEKARANADREPATSVQPPMAVARPATCAEASDSQALVVPAGVDSAQALQVVSHAPAELRQVVLDELAGNLRSQRKAITSPLGYLHSLVCKATAGTLIAPLAAEVSQQRQAHAAAKAREALGLGLAEGACAVGRVEAAVQVRDPAVIEEGRAKLMSARAQIIAAGAARSIGSGVQDHE